MMRDTSTGVVILAGVMFVSSLAAFVALVALGQPTATLERVVGPLLTAVIVTGVVGVTSREQHRRLDEQDRALSKITRQTNGVLDQRIKDGTKAALLELAEDERQGRLSEQP